MIYGVRASTIGVVNVSGAKCPHCEEQYHTMTVFGRYLHILWLPIIPLGRIPISECDSCKKTIKKKEFTAKHKELYDFNKSQIKRPWWHWVGPGAAAAFALMMTFTIATHEDDPRDVQLKSDLTTLDYSPSMDSDSISFRIKSIFDNFTNDEIVPQEFMYRTIVKEDKALVLVKIPSLKKVEKIARLEALEMIGMIIKGQKDLEGKDIYIGVQGKNNMMIVKSPEGEENRNLASSDKLYAFYGEKPATQ